MTASKFIFAYFLLSLGVLLVPNFGTAQWSTAVIDGIVNVNEYGNHTVDFNTVISGGTQYFVSWNDDSLYLATVGTNVDEPVIFYLDINPIIPVNGGTDADGSLTGFDAYERNIMKQPFRADMVLFVKNGFSQFRYADGAGGWSGANDNLVNYVVNTGTSTLEIAISWDQVTNGAGRPSQFNWFGYKAWGITPIDNGVYDTAPVGNPGCTCNQDPSTLYPHLYYNVLNTENGTSTPPFSTVSLTYYEDYSVPGAGGFYLFGGTYYDITVNDNSTDNFDNDPVNHVDDNTGPANRLLTDGNITINHDLYIGQGSALLPANNVGPDIVATITFEGSDGHIYNYGRIDANPEALAFDNWNRRRINLIFNNYTTLMSTPLFKDRYRLSNVTVNPGAFWVGPPSGECNFEFQWGVLDNNGTIDFGDGSTGVANVGTRGDWAQHNDYYFTSTLGGSITIFHHLLIGRFSSHLQPINGGGIIRLEMKGDFENYDEFTGESGGGRIDVIFNGIKKQFLRGHTGETTAATTTFYNLEIANDNGLNNQNSNADVEFETFGGGTIEYFVNGQLKMTVGDLITRNRSTPSLVHTVTLTDLATVDFSGCISNETTAPSAFVDGPMRYEVSGNTLVTREFPIGKTWDFGSGDFQDYRHMTFNVDQDVAGSNIYEAEMYIIDRSTAHAFPAPIPEVIGSISTIRYWDLQHISGPSVLESGVVTLHYNDDDKTDDVSAEAGLRILESVNNGPWVNTSPFIGGTASPDGNITSIPFTEVGEFVLAHLTDIFLPVEYAAFEVRKQEESAILTWETSMEIGTSHFVVERSTNAHEFQSVYQVGTNAESKSGATYQWNDYDLVSQSGRIYYRIKAVDFNGEFTYSKIKSVQLDSESDFLAHLFPNPNTGKFQIHVQAESELGEVRIECFDLNGRQMLNLRRFVDRNDFSFFIDENLPTGLYQYRVITSSEISNGKFQVR